jgi:hypothetical protein
MSYDLKAFCRDLQDRLTWLFKEVTRLQEENERLLKENKSLREEVTLARLFREIEPVSEGQRATPAVEDLFEASVSVSREAMEFYHRLPASFNFAEFFMTAEAEGIPGDTARDHMVVYFRENMLQQRGTRVEKTGTMPYPKRLAK